MAFDSSRGVTVLFGGRIGSTPAGDTWEWDGLEWRLAATTGPDPRSAHGMAYDSSREVTWLFGGFDGTRRSDTWQWDGASWTLASETGPVHLSGSDRLFAMAYDSHRRVTVLMGSTREQAETWQWDGRAWQLVLEGAPNPRWDHAMAYDSQRGTMIVFSGSLAGWRGDTWELRFNFDPHLEVLTFCPFAGPATFDWSCASPNGNVAVLFAARQGNVVIPPNQPCAGTQLGLGPQALQVVFTARSDSTGSGTRILNAPRAACGGFIQLIDGPTCTTSEVVRFE